MTPYIINFPRLHEELTSNPKPENIVFLASALFQGTPAPAWAPLVESIQSSLPLPLEEAQHKAKQLQEFGADLWDSKQLETLAAISQSKASEEKKHFSELEEIKNFIANHGQPYSKDKTPSTATTIENVRIGKELALCIAYELEQAILDTQTAIEQLGLADAAFRASLHAIDRPNSDLHDDGLKEILDTVPTLDKFATSPDINLPYLTVLEAILPFIPDDIRLFTNDENVLEALHEIGKEAAAPLEPLPGQEQFGLMHVPAWKLLRQKKANPALPWTTKTLHVCYPFPPTS